MGFGLSVESAISEGALRAILIKQQWVDAKLNRLPSNEGFKRCPLFKIASLFPNLGLAKGKRAYTKPLMYNQKTCNNKRASAVGYDHPPQHAPNKNVRLQKTSLDPSIFGKGSCQGTHNLEKTASYVTYIP